MFGGSRKKLYFFFLFVGSRLIPHLCLVEEEKKSYFFLLSGSRLIPHFCLVEEEKNHIFFCLVEVD